MFALPAAILITVACYTRLHEIIPFFQTLPVMTMLNVAGLLGVAIDLRLRTGLLRNTPHLPAVLLTYLWAVVTAILAAPATFLQTTVAFTFQVLLLLILSYGGQSFRALEGLMATLAVLAVFLALLGLDQGTSQFQCMVIAGTVETDAAGTPDGRPCTTPRDCYPGGDSASEYQCEKAGWLGTTSIGGGRVRYRGFLQDPNEMSTAIAGGLPLALTFLGRRRKWVRRVVMVPLVALVLGATVFTGSRTGQIIVIVAMLVMYGRGLGWKGWLAGALFAAPVLLLGGRGGEEASESTLERLEAWGAGLDMFRSSPLWGVGYAQFTQNHYLTAHNTFILVLAEMGLPGLVLWLCIPYACFKTMLTALRTFRDRPEAQVACEWARALLASLCVLMVAGQFLSLAYHMLMWIVFGACGAFYLAVRRHVPEFQVRLRLKDVVALSVFSCVYVVGVFAYVRSKGF